MANKQTHSIDRATVLPTSTGYLTATCSVCGPNTLIGVKSTNAVTGTKTYRCRVTAAPAAPYGGYVKLSTCECCGYTNTKRARHFEVHHVDGNHDNNTTGNHVTVCRFCHSDIEECVDNYIRGTADLTEWAEYVSKGVLAHNFIDNSKKAKHRLS